MNLYHDETMRAMHERKKSGFAYVYAKSERKRMVKVNV